MTEALKGQEDRKSGEEENRSRTGGMRKSEDERTDTFLGQEYRRSGGGRE